MQHFGEQPADPAKADHQRTAAENSALVVLHSQLHRTLGSRNSVENRKILACRVVVELSAVEQRIGAYQPVAHGGKHGLLAQCALFGLGEEDAARRKGSVDAFVGAHARQGQNDRVAVEHRRLYARQIVKAAVAQLAEAGKNHVAAAV